jgi:hypothetical protein
MLKSESKNMKLSDVKNKYGTGGDLFENIPEEN